MESFHLFSSALIASLLALVHIAAGHGAMTMPRARGTLNTNSLKLPDLGIPGLPRSNCPHCQNAGGPAIVKSSGTGVYSPYEPTSSAPFRTGFGLCGDKKAGKAPRAHEKGGTYGPPAAYPISADWKTGQTVTLEIDIHTNHNGFFEYYICDVSKCGGDISPKCFKDGHCKKLMRAPVPACDMQQSKKCAPIDPKYPGRFYVPCRKGGHVSTEDKVQMKYKLPAGFSCTKCVLQWYWATANSCNPVGFSEYFEKFPMKIWGQCPGDAGSKGGRSPGLSKCGPIFPEEFWNCADVRIGAGGASPAKPAPVAAPVAAPLAAPVKTPAAAGRPTPSATRPAPANKPSPRPTPPPNATGPVIPAGPAPATAGSCVKQWMRCGGQGYSGPTKCCGAYKCVRKDQWYSQCK